MQNSILVKMGMFCLALLAGIEHTSAQTKKNTDGYSVFTPAQLESATINDLAPEVGNGITSYSVTISCERKDLYDLTCTGDTLNSAFHAYLSKTEAKSCLCYFDKIVAGGKPVNGFVIEVVK